MKTGHLAINLSVWSRGETHHVAQRAVLLRIRDESARLPGTQPPLSALLDGPVVRERWAILDRREAANAVVQCWTLAALDVEVRARRRESPAMMSPESDFREQSCR
jgi:hypothetical protein